MIWKVSLTLSDGTVLVREVRAPTRGRALSAAVGAAVISRQLDVVEARVL